MAETGYQTGVLQSWGSIGAETHETNPDMMWPFLIDVVDRMRSEDSQVSSTLRAVTQPILSAEWVLDPAGSPDDVAAGIANDLGLPLKGKDFEAPLRTRGRFSWDDHLRHALLELPYGHSFFELVVWPDGSLRKLGWRPPRTIAEVKVAPDGGLIGIEQYGIAGKKNPFIPVDRLVAYVNEREGSNWLGRSVLRSAYKSWVLKDQLIRVQALAAIRNGLGLPVYTAPPPIEGSFEEQSAWVKEELARGLKVAKDTRAGESAGAALPHGGTLEFKGVTGKLPDIDQMIKYHDDQIGRAMLTHFLQLGGDDSTGSYALGDTFASFFINSLNAIAKHIASVTQQHVIEPLVDLRWGPTVRAPRLVPTKIGAHQQATAEALRALVEAKIIIPDDKLETSERAKYGLPMPDASTARTERQETA